LRRLHQALTPLLQQQPRLNRPRKMLDQLLWGPAGSSCFQLQRRDGAHARRERSSYVRIERKKLENLLVGQFRAR
jgi:hypothetical protein